MSTIGKMADAPIAIYNDNQNQGEDDVTKTGSPKPCDAQGTPIKPAVSSYSMLCENIENIAPEAIDVKRQMPVPTDKDQSVKIKNADQIQDGAVASTPVKVVRDLTPEQRTAPDANELERPVPPPVAKDQPATIDNADQVQDGAMAPTPVKVVKDLTQKQEGTLVRAALRSSIDRADAALLNDFVVRAQEKRAAKAAASTKEEIVTEKSSGSEASPDVECPTPTSRRVLEVMDEKSSSTDRAVSPPKQEIPTNVQEKKNVPTQSVPPEEASPPSPTCRRSKRVRTSARATPAPTTISLRRANGTELFAMERTEAQELALTTTKNTRQNKGKAVHPEYILWALKRQVQLENGQEADEEVQASGAEQAKYDKALATAHAVWEDLHEADLPRSTPTGKSVTWNDARLAEYSAPPPEWPELPEEEAGKAAPSTTKRLPKTGSSRRRNRSQMEEESANDAENAPSAPPTATASADAAPSPKRVRHAGGSTMGSGTPIRTGGGGTSRPPAPPAPTETATEPSTPTNPHRRVIPRSVSASALPAPVSRSSTSTSGIPTRTPSTPTTSAGSSGGRKRKTPTETNAGSTPMPRRVRARN